MFWLLVCWLMCIVHMSESWLAEVKVVNAEFAQLRIQWNPRGKACFLGQQSKPGCMCDWSVVTLHKCGQMCLQCTSRALINPDRHASAFFMYVEMDVWRTELGGSLWKVWESLFGMVTGCGAERWFLMHRWMMYFSRILSILLSSALVLCWDCNPSVKLI